MAVQPPNDWRISCKLSSPRPLKPSFLIALTEPAARTELRAPPACRLHARVRRLPARSRAVPLVANTPA